MRYSRVSSKMPACDVLVDSLSAHTHKDLIGQNEILTFGVLRGFAGTASATSTVVWARELICKDCAV